MFERQNLFLRKQTEADAAQHSSAAFFKENGRYPVWTCMDPIFFDSRDPMIIFSDSRDLI